VINRLVARDGAISISNLHGQISPAYWVLVPEPGSDARFINYLLNSSPYLAEIGARSKCMPPAQFDLPWEQFRTIPIACPDATLQRAIADYLDAETARIDALIA
jgi:type I restriction enzyme S subunit